MNIVDKMWEREEEAVRNRAEGFLKGALYASVFWIAVAVFVYLVKSIL